MLYSNEATTLRHCSRLSVNTLIEGLGNRAAVTAHKAYSVWFENSPGGGLVPAFRVNVLDIRLCDCAEGCSLLTFAIV